MHYLPQFNTCIVDADFVAAPDTTSADIAQGLVHEATHARLQRAGVAYREELRPRIERICRNAETRFLHRLPNANEALARLQQAIDREAHPDVWSDRQLWGRYRESRIEALRRIGCPDWIIRLVRRFVERGAA